MTRPDLPSIHASAAEEPASLRFHVYRSGDNPGLPAAEIALTAASERACTMTVRAENGVMEQLFAILEDPQNADPDCGQPGLGAPAVMRSRGDWMKRVLSDHAYELVEAAPSERAMTIAFDKKTGAMVARYDELDGHSGKHQDLAAVREVFEAVLAKFAGHVDELAARIQVLLAADADPNGNAKALELACMAYESGYAMRRPSDALLDALHAIDLAAASNGQARTVLIWRAVAAHQLRRKDAVARAAEALRESLQNGGDPDQAHLLQLIEAAAALQDGGRETALAIWRDMLKKPYLLSPSYRGQTYWNISRKLTDDDPDAAQAARHGADAFIESGDKNAAAKCLMRLSDCRLHTDPAQAIAPLDEALQILDPGQLLYHPTRAAVYHRRAEQHAKLRRFSLAYDDALAAVALWRGLLSMDDQIPKSLILASLAAQQAGQVVEASRLKEEADRLSAELGNERVALANRVFELENRYDRDEAAAALADATRLGDLELMALAIMVRAQHDGALAEVERLRQLEEILNKLLAVVPASPVAVSLYCAIGHRLVAMREDQRALVWFEKAFTAAPQRPAARQGIVDCLGRLEAWEDVAYFVAAQINMYGAAPGMTFIYAKAMFKLGEFSHAFRAARHVLAHAPAGSLLQACAAALAEEVMETAEKILPPQAVPVSIVPVTLAELEEQLAAFGAFVSGDKRMIFWRKPKDTLEYKWVARPEALAQNLLHTYLKATFPNRIEVYEELGTGAGRLDIYVKLHGGSAAIVELKMCGFGYTESYAAGGEKQITHYMDNRQSSIGYLVVFDARLQNAGQPLKGMPSQGSNTIKTVLVDVRPRVIGAVKTLGSGA